MNLASQAGDLSSNLLFVNFNQDCTSLAVGSKVGFKLLSLGSVDKLEQIYESDTEDICIVERLFSSSLVAIVSLSSPRKLKVCHFKKGTEICNYSYSNTILAVRLNRQRLVVCLEESLYIHNIRDMKVLHTIRDTPPNPSGLCALSISNDNCYLAYPGSNQIGEVQIFDTINLRAVTMIPAHDNPLAAMTFDGSGTKIATASSKGTVIRVFSIPDGQRLFEFRRGLKRCVDIFSLGFSADALYLCASSNTETVHIFKLENPHEKKEEEPQGWMGYFGHAIKSSANYLPSQVSDMLHQWRAFATARLPVSQMKTVCALAKINKAPRLLVACQDGHLYIFNLEPSEGGECPLLKQHRLDGRQDSSTGDVGAIGSLQDKPLASPPVNTYAATVRKADAGSPPSSLPRATPPGKHEGEASSLSPNGDYGSYAHALKMTDSAQKRRKPTDLLKEVVDVESQPYEDVEPHGAVGGSPEVGITGLRLDDDNEFPPMTHETD